MDVNLLCSREICNNLPGIINIIINVIQFCLQFIGHVIAEQSKISQYFISLKMQSESYAKSTRNRLIAVAGLANSSYGLFTLHGNETRTCTANRTGRMGYNGTRSLSCLWLAWTFLHGPAFSIWSLYRSQSCSRAVIIFIKTYQDVANVYPVQLTTIKLVVFGHRFTPTHRLNDLYTLDAFFGPRHLMECPRMISFTKIFHTLQGKV